MSYSKKAVVAWSLYDFANSAFTTLVVTFVYSTYFTKTMAADEMAGTALWTKGAAVSAVLIALLSPFLGTVADRGGLRKAFLAWSTLICVGFTTALYFVPPGPEWGLLALGLFVAANVGFEVGGVFYNAFLPDIAPPEKLGRISGYGWACGYVGGLLALIICLVALIQPETPWLGFAKQSGQNVRASNLVVAVWFAVFSLPLFLFVREDRSAATGLSGIFGATLRQMAQTFREIRRYREVLKLLVARLVYNDGLNTIFALGGVYAGTTFGFKTEEIIEFGIVLNIAAGLGAFLLGFLDDVLGGKRTILLSIVGLMASTTLAALTHDKTWFWVAGIGVGIFAGPNQAASRSLLARFVPPAKENEFFGFFAFTGKATSFLGPLLFGELTLACGSQRYGVAALLAFFLAGGLLLLLVDEAEGRRLAQRDLAP